MPSDVSVVRSNVIEEALAAEGFPGARHGPPRPDAVARILADIPLFSGLSGRQLRKLAGRATVHRCRGGQPMARAGFSAEALYVLLTGSARVERDGARVDSIARGGFFGELGLLDDEPRLPPGLPDRDLWARRVPPQAFIDLIRAEPAVVLMLLRELARRLRRYAASE